MGGWGGSPLSLGGRGGSDGQGQEGRGGGSGFISDLEADARTDRGRAGIRQGIAARSGRKGEAPEVRGRLLSAPVQPPVGPEGIPELPREAEGIACGAFRGPGGGLQRDDGTQ